MQRKEKLTKNGRKALILVMLLGLLFLAICSVTINASRKNKSNELYTVKADEQVQYHTAETQPELILPHRYKGITEKITKTEIDLLTKIVWLESRGECDEGQQGVVEVIFNRVLNEKFPNTIHNVIYERNQFSSVPLLYTATPTDREYLNVWLVLEGYTNVLEDDVVYFSRGKMNNRPFKKIGNHWFCKI